MNTLRVVLAFGLICLATGESVVSITLNKAEGQIYALSTGNWLYELDNAAVVKNNKHSLNVTVSPTITSSFIKKTGTTKSLYQTLSDPTYGTFIARFDLPFGNKPVLTASATTTPEGYGYSGVPTAFVDKESIAITVSNGNILNLFNLATMTQTDEIHIFQGIRLGATALVYNQKTHTAVVFWYQFLSGSRTYRLFVHEYEVVNHKFVELNTTYPEDPADFADSRAEYAAFDSSNNVYWILDDQQNRLVKFDAANLATYSFVPLGAVSFEQLDAAVSYNFGAQLAYVVSDAAAGFYLQEVDLSSGAIRRAATFNTGNHAAATVYLDTEEGNLYVGLISDPTDKARVSVIDLGNFQQQIITLNH